uniref:Uncharacterized protein n=1 Tax=Glossina brevipalpis TaxID=37001 RepID=A0A1A9WJU4_9MUSC
MLFENPAVAAKLPFPYNVPPPLQAAAAAAAAVPNLRVAPDFSIMHWSYNPEVSNFITKIQVNLKTIIERSSRSLVRAS